LGWLFGVHALLLSLTFAGLIGSLFSSKTFTSLCMQKNTSAFKAFASLMTAQLVGSALWWWIAGKDLNITILN